MKSSCKLSLESNNKAYEMFSPGDQCNASWEISHKSRGNVISMAYDEKVIMVILFQFRKNGFVIF